VSHDVNRNIVAHGIITVNIGYRCIVFVYHTSVAYTYIEISNGQGCIQHTLVILKYTFMFHKTFSRNFTVKNKIQRGAEGERARTPTPHQSYVFYLDMEILRKQCQRR